MQRCDDDEHNNDAVEQQTRNLCSNNNIHATSFRDHLHSIALLASFRRLSFLFLSIMVVNFVRSTILKIPKSDKKMFDQCPWPFTLFHDPMKFIKDGATHVVVLWVGMCQLYSYWEKARRAIILP
ncbi:hypothetical protein ACHAWU_002559 [Discostella pseudostelligera]|uniref:Uncharacterized protein n=1 Tax=Discostella pseudostelligera TaxID=259834 RepID=A0ABD3M1P5_9STRA